MYKKGILTHLNDFLPSYIQENQTSSPAPPLRVTKIIASFFFLDAGLFVCFRCSFLLLSNSSLSDF